MADGTLHIRIDMRPVHRAGIVQRAFSLAAICEPIVSVGFMCRDSPNGKIVPQPEGACKCQI